jgi:site-specific DNA-adenine methylase
MAEPVVSYPGAKWRFYPYMVEYFPIDMKTFVEPFFGGGSITLSVADDPRFSKLERMVAGDLYTEMWAFWTGVKEHPDEVVELAKKMFDDSCPHQKELYATGFIKEVPRDYMQGGKFASFETDNMFTEEDRRIIRDKLALYNVACEEGKRFWEWAQSVDCASLSIPARAARMLLVNKVSFSGMGDAGSLSRDQFTAFTEDCLNKVFGASKLLNDKDVEIMNVSFEETMKIANENPESSFIFLDPPYAKQESSGLYGKGGNTHKGFPHQHFAEFTKTMLCKWFMTYDDSIIVRKLFQGKTIDNKDICIKPFSIPGGYTMAGKTADDALAGEELFIANYSLEEEVELEDF